MRRRRLLLVVGAVALLGVAGFALFLWLSAPATTPVPTPGVTLENFRRLRKGMSARDVEAVLGKSQATVIWPRGSMNYWFGEEVIILGFDTGQRLNFGFAKSSTDQSSNSREELRKEETFLDRIRQWLP